MNFLEAAEIAKRNPGSHFTRGASGLFVVYLKDGREITSPGQIIASSDATEGPLSDELAEVEEQSAGLSRTIALLVRQQQNSDTEIRQLRREVNSLKEAISKIPSSEWSRYEEEHRRLDEERKVEERDRIVGLARKGALSHDQLDLVADNALALGIAQEDLEFIRSEVVRMRPRGISADSLVVHATTDGQ